MELKTNRLYIRELLTSDWLELQKITKDFTKSKYVVYDCPLPTGDNEVKELTKKFAESQLFYAVFRQNTPEMIGYVCFHANDNKYDLGYCFHSSYYGNGYAFESCTAMLKYINQHFRINSFTAGTAIDNVPSCNLLMKLGFRCEETEILSFHKDEFGNNISFEGGNFVLEVEE